VIGADAPEDTNPRHGKFYVLCQCRVGKAVRFEDNGRIAVGPGLTSRFDGRYAVEGIPELEGPTNRVPSEVTMEIDGVFYTERHKSVSSATWPWCHAVERWSDRSPGRSSSHTIAS
jgi:hypothetical protein